MDSTNNNNNQMLFVSELKELRKELSAVKKRIVQLEESHEKQQEKINILERENHALKKYTELNNLDDNTADGSTLKRRRTDKHPEDEIESEPSVSVSTLASSDKKKVKTNNKKDDDDEVTVLSLYDNGDSFDSLSDDLLHKIVEFDGNCYKKFGSINKRCKNIYDVEEYKLNKETCVFGYGTIDMMLQHYLQKRKEGTLNHFTRCYIAEAVIGYNRLDAIDWIIQLGDVELLNAVCRFAANVGRINILSRVFCKCNLTMLDELLNDSRVCGSAAYHGKLETLKWLRKYDAKCSAYTFFEARVRGYDEIVQYFRSSEGYPESDEDTNESSE